MTAVLILAVVALVAAHVPPRLVRTVTVTVAPRLRIPVPTTRTEVAVPDAVPTWVEPIITSKDETTPGAPP